MPHISGVGRRSIPARCLVGTIYLALTAGAVTMVYPFLLMVSGSFKTNVDKYDFDIVPAFFHDDTVLYRKFLECKYNNDLTLFNVANRQDAANFRDIDPPSAINVGMVSDWKEFERVHIDTPEFYILGFMSHRGDRLMLWKHREFMNRVRKTCGNDIREYRRRYGSQNESWLAVGGPSERITERRYQLSASPLEKEFHAFKSDQPSWFRIYPGLDGVFVRHYLIPVYGNDISACNAAHGTDRPDYSRVTLSRTVPARDPQRSEWEEFVRAEVNLRYIDMSGEARPLFAGFLRERYSGDIALLNRRYGSGYGSFEEVEYPEDRRVASVRLTDWAGFVKSAPAEYLRLTGPAFMFRDFLRGKYAGDINAMNRRYGARFTTFDTVPIPVPECDYADFLENRNAIRKEFIASNYRQVADYIVLHGRSLVNTVIYCLLAVLAALTVNPMAAYALSRYKPPSAYKLLLFCMATMAFPPAVTMIPNFLLLKELGMLNTFSALVLPGIASGFSIFLLKGFFDSLPRELYESAQLDGAGEWTMFWHLSMMLSKPILAVIALQAFTMAYGNFMFAFILCPDPGMWTLMVFLYQLGINGHMGLTFAALLMAAVPTFLVFVFCQNMIIRGIVVPVEK